MRVSVVVPTFNEQGNVSELIARLDAALADVSAEIVFVDDSTDATVAVVHAAAPGAHAPVSILHREAPVGGLSGAVVAGMADSRGDWVVVMDGDLQHPPERVPALLAAAGAGADVIVASRYCRGGSSGGLATPGRAAVSRGATALARMLLPGRLRWCTDPMSGFFAVRRSAVDLSALRPRGFKILLEILGRHRLRVAEIPLVFGERASGVSKADARQGLQYLGQLARLRLAHPIDARPDPGDDIDADSGAGVDANADNGAVPALAGACSDTAAPARGRVRTR